MPTWKRTLQLAQRNPKGVKHDNLCRLLEHFGFVGTRPGGGSSHIGYRHEDYADVITLQSGPNGFAPPYQVKLALSALRALGKIDG